MIREPAQAKEEATSSRQVPKPKSNQETDSSSRTYSSNCNCSQKKTTQTELTTIPIVINSQTNPRIILVKVPSRSSRAEQIAPRTRLIRIPFLPGSVPTPPPMKQALPTKSNLVNSTTSATASPIATRSSPTPHHRHQPEQFSGSCNSLNQVASDPTTTALGSPTLNTVMVNQTVTVSKTPKTLASMAGIQLTGADMQSHQDMSGAMPTATVEEIDVPVFIDEYLQELEASSKSSCSKIEEDNETEICTETDIFDFDFDINLIAEDCIEQKEMDQCSLDMDMDNNNSDITNIDLIKMDDLEFKPMVDGEEAALDIGSICNAILINNNQYDDISLHNMLTSSEDPVLGTFSQTSMLSGDPHTKCFDELPLLSDETSMDYNYNYSQTSLGFSQLEVACDDLFSVQTVAAAAVPVAPAMTQKRSALRLDTSKPTAANLTEAINTPDIIATIASWLEPNCNSNISSQENILKELVTAEDNNTSTSFNDFSAPNTPYSVNSASTYYSLAPASHLDVVTAPSSPASVASVASNKRKRGRPAKDHADGPDPKLIKAMSPEEAKSYTDRIKNNEASRVSRRKTKQREDEEKTQENELQLVNDQRRAILQRLTTQTQKLHDFLKRNHHSNSTYVSPQLKQ
ncbi:uncharacterized protein LOC108603429 [Drosophila busckii]|uniref:uncharacterized protein LOC108603429 n=1 Tax=Drosophila busckii TaxID=30019 RepID=UPI00083EC5B4|nr:uncharacterized protein LOC108603429 [Drosophila busckii]